MEPPEISGTTTRATRRDGYTVGAV